jgi:hypothetical protein
MDDNRSRKGYSGLDDEVDASGSLEMLNQDEKRGLYESYRKQAEQLRVKKEGS